MKLSKGLILKRSIVMSIWGIEKGKYTNFLMTLFREQFIESLWSDFFFTFAFIYKMILIATF